jgi:hypothetical protein
MFKFNFNLESSQSEDNHELECAKNVSNGSNAEQNQIDSSSSCENGLFTFEQLAEKQQSVEKSVQFNRVYLTNDLITSDQLSADDTHRPFVEFVNSYKLQLNDDETIISQINKTHDLVPGKYEGGLKVWELSVDLARFVYNINLVELNDVEQLEQLDKETIDELNSIRNFYETYLKKSGEKNELRILELGCGHALPTLSCIQYLIDHSNDMSQNLKIVVYLQDFNKLIVEQITFENVKRFIQLNSDKRQNLDLEFKFVYGDWRQLLDMGTIFPKDYFDLILTSETIYNSCNYTSLLNIFKECMANTYSFVLLSAKTYYFGCGGNLLEFTNLAKSSAFKFNTSKNLLFNSIITFSVSDIRYHSTKAEQELQNEKEKDVEEQQKQYINSLRSNSSSHTTSEKKSKHSSTTKDTFNIAKEIIKLSNCG